ncbi:FG-GAP-like repeat-containing protein [Streptomyces solicathayae]|uniref:N-acetylmuramoyl-L-alanine amidase n=1 Tax=Streptomyces solicathayae TaxID=3081768 RepID=A0ABZ0LSS4_9ACTN|nr:FG-GAP-like repeat-containing protein [Streptomyces sp. HUAS YS2]WOX22533.1 N-acetylmuramoyl-L-alanine amidase [Streptomyces sp. HUAS YS2]
MGHLSPRRSHAYRPLSTKRRAWLTLGAVVLGGAGVVTVAVANPSDEPPKPPSARKGGVFDYALEATAVGKRELASTDTKTFSMVGVSWDSAKAKFDGAVEVRTRSVETGKWSGWQHLERSADQPEGSDLAGVRGSTEPLWVGASNGAQARVVDQDGSRIPLPGGLELNLIDPGVTPQEATAQGRALQAGPQDLAFAEPAAFVAEESATPEPPAPTSPTTEPGTGTDAGTGAEPSTEPTPATSAPESPAASPSGTPSTEPTPEPTATVPVAPPSNTTKPPIISRAQWGADETKVEDPPEYIEKIQAAYIHHTVDSNNYSCSESAALVRGIFLFHVQSNGWNDLGYNFLVDKCGRIFEGRGGGTDLPVKGAHTSGFNSYSTGIALLGNFETGKPTRAALESAARIAAYKLGQYGVSPTGKVTLTRLVSNPDGSTSPAGDVTFNTISGHRDGFATECPGANLYSKLGAIRDFAAKPGRNSAIPTSDFNRDGITDLVVGLPREAGFAGRVSVLPGTTAGPSHTAKKNLDQNSAGVPDANEASDLFGYASAWGDVNGDGNADLVVGVPGEDGVTGQTDTGSVSVLYGPGLSSGQSYWTAARAAGEKVGTVVTSGDFNADGKADILSVAPGAPGRWWAWDGATGTAKSGYLNTAAYTAAVGAVAAATGDFDKDGYADVAINYRDPSSVGRVLVLKGSSAGLTRGGLLSTRGGRSLAAGDLNGDGYDDIVVGQPATTESGHALKGGAVTAVLGSSTGLTATGSRTLGQDSANVYGTGEVGDDFGAAVSIGDVNLDGYGDVLVGMPGQDISANGTVLANAGMAIYLPGTSTGPTGTGSTGYAQGYSGLPGAAEANDRFGSAVTLKDLSGYVRADLAIGADGEDANNGTIVQIDNGSAGVARASGLYYGMTQLGTVAGARIGMMPLVP